MNVSLSGRVPDCLHVESACPTWHTQTTSAQEQLARVHFQIAQITDDSADSSTFDDSRRPPETRQVTPNAQVPFSCEFADSVSSFSANSLPPNGSVQ
jgi:hypothetical protein